MMAFDWHVYLSETGAETSPTALFEHVNSSMDPLIRKGQTVEAVSCPYVDDSDASELDWWPAEVALISGSLILFKWCSPNDGHSDDKKDDKDSVQPSKALSNGFWFDVRGSNWHLLRPIRNPLEVNSAWRPPDCFGSLLDGILLETETEWIVNLRKRAVPVLFFQQHILYGYESIRCSAYVECEHEHNPNQIWPAKVILNVGGRLKLIWFGNDGRKLTGKSCTKIYFTLFYLHRRIHPLGWGKLRGLTYCPPDGLFPERTISNVDAFIRGAKSAFPFAPRDVSSNSEKHQHKFPLPNREPPCHDFKVGWKLEAVNPTKPFMVQPATVTKVFNNRYFLVELDDLSAASKAKIGDDLTTRERVCFVSHAGMANIMPVNSSQTRGFNFVPPMGWPSSRPFTWTNYLVFLTNESSFFNGLENGLLTGKSNSIPLTNHVQPSSDPHGTPSEHVTSVYCPSEVNFKGVETSEPRSPTIDPIPPCNSPSPPVNSNCDDKTKSTPGQSSTVLRFLLGMKLEMVIPDVYLTDELLSDVGPKLCTATVTRVEGTHMLWLLPDLPPSMCSRPVVPIIVDSRSTDLYPVGWAALFGHPIVSPVGYEDCSVDSSSGQSVVRDDGGPTWNVPVTPTHDLQLHTISYESEAISPPLYINTKCYIGPFLCRANLELLPSRFGPGPITRVMHNLLTRLISAAYRPIRVLRMFEADWATGMASALTTLRSAQHNSLANREGVAFNRSRFNLHNAKENVTQAETEVVEQRRSGMRVVILRIRCPRRGVKIEAPVEVCCRARAVDEFCRQVSLVLEACPFLISTTPTNTHNSLGCGVSGDGIPSAEECDCPSFCLSRLRSRNLERLPGWKRKVSALTRSTGFDGLPDHVGKTIGTRIPTHRTRSAAQQHGSSRPLPSFNHSNTVQTSTRRSGRASKRIRTGSMCRTAGSPPGNPQTFTNGTESFPSEQKLPTQERHHFHTSSIPPRTHHLWLNSRVHPYLNHSLHSAHRYRPLNHHHNHEPIPLNHFPLTNHDIPRVTLSSNPLFWSPVDLATYLGHTDCREMWPWLAAEAVDGQAFMLLTLPVLHHLVGLRWEDAVRLARHVASVKRAFLEQFSDGTPEDRKPLQPNSLPAQ